MKVIVDMNMSPAWARLFNEAGIESLHWSSIGANDALDVEIATYAQEHGFAVFTNDLDFGHLLAFSRWDQPSVIQIRDGELKSSIVGLRVVAALIGLKDAIEEGALVTIDSKRTRVRILPI